jgi:integrase
VHQEFRVLRRIFNVAVKKKLCPSNPCSAVEFPTSVGSLFRPHYVTWSEQQRIEACAPPYLANVIRIITETGLRVYKELTQMRKDQVDLANGVVWIPASKTPNGIAEVPLTEIAVSAGGVADEWVTQLLRQGDSMVFKKYSQMKLQMKREALQKLNRRANELGRSFDTARGT